MKVGILVGDSPLPEEFFRGLESAGMEVEVHTIQTSAEPAISLAQAGAFLKKAESCDLIHNFTGGLGLLFASMTGKLMVSSIPESLSREDADLFRAAGHTSFFVSERVPVESIGLKGIPGIEAFSGDRVRFYLDVYSRVMSAGRKKEVRPWGSFEVLSDDRDDHKVKRIVVLPGKRLSLQYHGKRREHWIIISGQAMVTVGKVDMKLSPTETIDIPHGKAHRIENIGTLDLVFIEVQQGDYFGEDDIVRIEDDFGRI